MTIEQPTQPVPGTESTPTQPDSSPEPTNGEPTPPVEGQPADPSQPQAPTGPAPKVPFHQDPELQDYINRQVDKKLQERTPPTAVTPPAPAVDVPIPAWFGGDADQWKAFQAHQEETLKKHGETVRKQIEEEKKAEEKRVKEANDYFNDEVLKIEKANPGAKIDRNKLLKFVIDNDLIDSQGRWNYAAGYRFMTQGQPTQPKPNTPQRKQAGSVPTDPTGEPQKKEFKTSDDFKTHRPW